MDSNNAPAKRLICSSVIVLHELSTDSLILTKRSETLRYHPGEICFPGGLQEAEDNTSYATALRELEEEIGVSGSRVKLIKELPHEKTLLGVIIHPWMATIDSVQPYQLNPQEVTKLISVPMSLVLDPDNYREFTLVRFGTSFQTYQFLCYNETIWGATARIMHQLSLTTKK